MRSADPSVGETVLCAPSSPVRSSRRTSHGRCQLDIRVARAVSDLPHVVATVVYPRRTSIRAFIDITMFTLVPTGSTNRASSGAFPLKQLLIDSTACSMVSLNISARSSNSSSETLAFCWFRPIQSGSVADGGVTTSSPSRTSSGSTSSKETYGIDGHR